MTLLEACREANDCPSGDPCRWDVLEIRTFLLKRVVALRRVFEAITTACATGPTYGVLIFVTCKASGFLFQDEAGPRPRALVALDPWS